MREPKMTPIAIDQPFQFDCHPQVPCFNACCRDLNQVLTPYDILRLKHHFQMTAGQLLATYTTQHLGPQTGLPVVTLTPVDDGRRRCPFVSPQGCRVYADRPSSCRIYPVARAVVRNRQDGKKTEHFALLQEPHCRGFQQTKTRTVAEWMVEQDLAPYFDINDLFLDLIQLKNRHFPGPLEADARQRFQTALYDVDTFRCQRLDDGASVSPPGGRRAQRSAGPHSRLFDDDVDLLRYAHQWIKKELFGVPPD